jgi:hypothetical protein
MLMEVRPSPSRTSAPITWALVSGVAGVVANVLLVAFFVLALGLGLPQYGWLGTVNDAVIMVQFLTLVPVALVLLGWLPPRRAVRLATVAAVVGMVLIAVLQLLLIVRVLTFDVQVLMVVIAFLPVYGWVLTISSVGHRSGTLPRPVTRFGLLLGVSFPVGLLIFVAGLPFGWGSVAQLLFAVAGGVLGGLSWLALPVWPLLLARLVFTRPRPTSAHEKGESS